MEGSTQMRSEGQLELDKERVVRTVSQEEGRTLSGSNIKRALGVIKKLK